MTRWLEGTERLAERPPAATHLLLAYRWPGNVRELENEMQRALAEAGEVITPKLLSERVAGILEPIEAAAPRPPASSGSREGLYKEMKRLGIE